MGLSESDGWAITTAIGILRESGYQVEKVSNGQKGEDGEVQFRLDVEAKTHYPRFQSQAEAAKDAVKELPNFGMGGNAMGEGDG